MARKDSHIWSPIRLLRGKREGTRASENVRCACDDHTLLHDGGVEGDHELFNRVQKWLQESQLPQLDRFTSSEESQPLHPIKKKISIDPISASTSRSQEIASNTILYHPDFADWSCIQLHAEKRHQIQSMEEMLSVGMKIFQF
jgi:hypothetical protein